MGDGVTREQMAAFMRRFSQYLGAEDGTPAVADRALTPVAYATVLADGSVVAARSRGVGAANVTLEKTSSYCFRDLAFEFTTAQATPIYEGGPAVDSGVEIGLPGVGFGAGDCAGTAAQLEVATIEDSEYATHGSYVWFYD